MSGFYIGVDGKARKVKGGYIGVDGVARKIKKGYIGDENGVARLCWSGIDPVFANNSWEQIAAACQTRQVPGTWAIGDQKTMTIDGTDYTIDIIGKNHDDYSDGSGKAPLTFQLHDCYEKQLMNTNGTNSGSWAECEMRTEHLPAIFAQMPVEVQNSVKQVSKPTCNGYNIEGVTYTKDTLFLLSEIEVFGVRKYSLEGEGTQYQYYAGGGQKIKTDGVYKGNWWLRSPYGAGSAYFCNVSTIGDQSANPATNYYGISFAFCF